MKNRPIMITTTTTRHVAALVLGALMASCLQAQEGPAWEFGGDLRGGFYASERDGRDGSTSSDESLRSRLRFFAQRELSERWLFRGRVATWMTTQGNDWSVRFDPYRASGTGTRSGEVHLDELYLRWRDAAQRHQLRLGRFQTSFNLPVVPDKSLDRNDSSNVGIGWTDGVHWQARLGGGWESHIIGQFNHRRGTGNTVRGPLDFSDGSSRLGTYLALRSTERLGPLSMRMLSLNWIPDALATHGVDDSRREDYLTMTAKAAAEWPVGDAGTRFVLAGEYGHAFNTPQRSTMRVGTIDDVSGDGFQISANLFDFRPDHNIGFVYGRVESGWLISNDFSENNHLYEVRYQHYFMPQLRMDIRFRIREEIDRRLGAEQKQEDRDMYLRFTWRL